MPSIEETTSSSLGLLDLHRLMNDEFRELVVRHVLSTKEQAPREANQWFDETLREKIEVRGFRDASKVPPLDPRLVSAVSEKVKRSAELFGAVLQVWTLTQPHLAECVTGYLKSLAKPCNGLDFSTRMFRGRQSLKAWQQDSNEIQERYTEFNKDDIALMLCCVSGFFPDPRSGEEANNKTEDVLLHSLEYLRALPPDSIEWDATVADFAASIETIRSAKRDEREKLDNTNNIANAVAELNQDCEEEVEYFQFPIGTWSAEKFRATSDLPHALDLFAKLRDLLLEFRKVRSQGLNLDEEKRRRPQRESLEANIQTVEDNIQQLLSDYEGLGEDEVEPKAESVPLNGNREKESANTFEGADCEVSTVDPDAKSELPADSKVSPERIPYSSDEQNSSAVVDEVGQHFEPAKTKNTDDVEQLSADKDEGRSIGEEYSTKAGSDEGEGLESTEKMEQGDQRASENRRSAALSSVDSKLVPKLDGNQDFSDNRNSESSKGLRRNGDSLLEEAAPEVEVGSGVSSSEFGYSPLVAGVESGTRLEIAEETYIDGEETKDSNTSREIAELWLRDQSSEFSKQWVWSLLAEDDLPAAYWLTRSLEAEGNTTPLPSPLLAAIQGARWLNSNTSLFSQDLLQIASSVEPVNVEAVWFLRLASALRPALLAPTSGMLSWLNEESVARFPSLHSLIVGVKKFAKLNIVLSPEDLSGVSSVEQCEVALKDTVREAEQWLAKAPGQRIEFRRALGAWRSLVGQRGILNELLQPVCQDQRNKLESVRGILIDWQLADKVRDRLRDIDYKVAGKASLSRPIQGKPLQRLMRNIQHTCDLAQRWCDLVERGQALEEKGNWISGQVNLLRTSVREVSSEAMAELECFCEGEQSGEKTAAATCLKRAVQQLVAELLPDLGTDEVPVEKWDLLIADAGSLESALSRRLLLFPDLLLDDNGLPREERKFAGVLASNCVEQPSFQEVVDGWLNNEDYRFVGQLLECLSEESMHTELARRFQERLDSSRASLRGRIDNTTEQVEQALADDLISEAERSEHIDEVSGTGAEDTLNFPESLSRHRNVLKRLEDARNRRLEDLKHNWEEIQRDSRWQRLEKDDRERFENRILSGLKSVDTRVVGECIAQLYQSLDNPILSPGILLNGPDERSVLQEFTESIRPIEQLLSREIGLKKIVGVVKNGKNEEGLKFADIPKLRRDEAVRAIEAWRRLKQKGQKSFENRFLVTLLEFLGFENHQDTTIETHSEGTDWIHLLAHMTTGESVLPIPQFGSMIRGPVDVICLWKRPAADVIASRLRDLRLNSRRVVVLYLGRLTNSQRKEVARTCREHTLVPVFLDEILLLFLAQEPGHRLPTFLQCSLPLTALNPYTPFQAGDVPPEMFFGRQEMVRELQRQAGSCLVYGGRQLGKSSLLRHVQRQFHHPERDEWAWIEDMKLCFDSSLSSHTGRLWTVLRERFQEFEIMSKGVTTSQPETLSNYILTSMNESPQRRVLVMLDEADQFLEADADNEFREVLRLRDLMDKTNRRFKVIFAGLHSVQRFQGIPNQPLAHFGASLRVGPLEPEAAQQLVRKPLETLGFRFAKEGDVLRILSYTNYHPGLIQSFCQDLLKGLHKRFSRSLPPYNIEQADVEGVYLLPEVRERIRERFDWTLALDTRYQAIAWAIILEQMGGKGSYTSAYPASEILRQVRIFWESGFKETGYDQMQSLLGEMRGLGVLERDNQGRYRLRSPNLVRLMGSTEDIENRLLELADKKPPSTLDRDSYHVSIDDGAQHYSPLSHIQESNLNQQHFGVGLISCSNALGFSEMEDALRNFISAERGAGSCVNTPPYIVNSRRFQQWLSEDWRKAGSRRGGEPTNRLILHTASMHNGMSLLDLVETAQKFCNRHRPRTGRQSLRILFLLDPKTTWAWLSLTEEVRDRIEEQVVANIVPHQWDVKGIRKRLDQHDMMHTEEVCDLVLGQTGGWHMLLDELFDRNRKRRSDDPRPDAEDIGQELKLNDSHLRKRFWNALGLEVHECVGQVLDLVRRNGAVDVDMIVPEMFEGESPYGVEEYARAVEYLTRFGCLTKEGDSVQVEETVAGLMALT